MSISSYDIASAIRDALDAKKGEAIDAAAEAIMQLIELEADEATDYGEVARDMRYALADIESQLDSIESGVDDARGALSNLEMEVGRLEE